MKFLILFIILATILLILKFSKKKQDKFKDNKVNTESIIDLEIDPKTKEYKPKD
ncbi:hypothetical protein OAJ12_03900 [Pelagibacteraceae bacterium]|nr:hypothetical protein [Pelagibacteraceae bacterium]|tara:strand:- start:1289 stop:1450 length:162 start_codon:yes stop_codon:yes gene_type:complete